MKARWEGKLVYKNLRKKIDNYFEGEGEKTYSGFVEHLGIKSIKEFEELLNMVESGRYEKMGYGKRMAELIIYELQRGLLKLEKIYEEKLFNNGKQVVGVIFALKNRFKWVDRSELGGGLVINLNIKGVDSIEDGKEKRN